ncbi:MAG: hypothetical protein FWG18_02650, partial [Alphaproteobacteria bacterium]|nr:hypothetical protein [Alphaproteobacteria bacterium]
MIYSLGNYSEEFEMVKNPGLSKDAKLLLAFQSLYQISNLFLGTFFVSFIMQNSMNEILSVSMYNLFLHLALAAGFFAVADWVKRRDKVAVFRLNLIPKAVCLLGIIFLKESAVDFIVPLGILFGLNIALYWSPMHLMTGEKVPCGQISKFIGYRAVVSQSTKVIAPLALGLFITSGSYEEMAIALLALCFIEFALTLFMKPSM